MTDNARIVRVTLENASAYFHDIPESAVGGDDEGRRIARLIRAAGQALTALEAELATAKADLERAREALKELEHFPPIVSNILSHFDQRKPEVGKLKMEGVKTGWVKAAAHEGWVKATLMAAAIIRAALAPEQKG